MRSAFLTTASLLVASLAAAVVLTGDGPWRGGSDAMLAIGHLLLTAVTIVAALVGSARWSVNLGIGLAALLMGPAVAHRIDIAWVVMVVAGSLAATGLLAGGMRATVRGRPPADGPPRGAVLLALGLMAGPLVVAVGRPSGVAWPDWAVATGAVVAAAWYSQARPGALWVARLGTPLLAVAGLVAAGLPPGIVPATWFAVLTVLAWTVDARIAVLPLTTPGRRVPMPPELTPGEILDAAGLDDRGRSRDR